MFFFKPDYRDANAYDLRYANIQGEKENRFIQKVLERYIPVNCTLFDYGCGSGLGRKLTKNIPLQYVGIDKELYSQYQYKAKAGDFVKGLTKEQYPDVSIALFSANYFGAAVFDRIVQTSGRVIAVVYDKPFMPGSVSVYAKRPAYFWVHHWRSRKGIFDLIKRYHDGGRLIHLSKVCGEPFYKICVIEGGANGGE